MAEFSALQKLEMLKPKLDEVEIVYQNLKI